MRSIVILFALAIRAIAQLPGNSPVKPVTGTFYASVDDHATIYVNGQKTHQADYGAKRSAELNLKVGDLVLIDLKNDRDARGFLLVFRSSDDTTLINFRRADFKIVPDLDVTDFTADQFKRWTKTAKSSPRKEMDLPFKNYSEWVWGESDKCILAAIVTSQMVTPKPK